jgi:hypothetical protein
MIVGMIALKCRLVSPAAARTRLRGRGSCVTGVTYSTVVQVACTRPGSSLKNML